MDIFFASLALSPGSSRGSLVLMTTVAWEKVGNIPSSRAKPLVEFTTGTFLMFCDMEDLLVIQFSEPSFES